MLELKVPDKMKKLSSIFSLLFISTLIFSQEVAPVKNVIMMIPDGTSIGVYTAARWFKHYNGLGDTLHIDPYLTGTVTTFSSNAPIGDSAPTSSTYATACFNKRATWPFTLNRHPTTSTR